MNNKELKNHGSAILITMLLTFVIALAVAGAIRLVSHELVFSTHSSQWIQALQTAEAGVEVGMAALQQEIETGYSWSSWSQSGSIYTLASVALAPTGHNAPNSQHSISVDKGTLTVVATGQTTEPRTGGTITRTVQVTLEPEYWYPFEKALLAKDTLNIIGTPYADSYNSTNGGYGGWNVSTNCSIGSLSTSAGGITGGGAAQVKGDVYVTDSGSAVGGFWSGQVRTGFDADIPDVTPPFTTITDPAVTGGDTFIVAGSLDIGVASMTGMGGSKNVTIQGQGLCRVYIDGDMDFGTPTELTITPDPVGSDLQVEFYVNGNIDLKGTLNYNGDPGKFTIYGTPNCQTINCQANNDKMLTIYAPQADVALSGNAAIYGAVVANNINMTGTFDFHYDENLASKKTSTPVGYKITSWREL